ncbi:MAG: hypothetical protein EB830_01820 [Nitrosopumilus sp. H13]|nr:MAG: hypothetical protein EB830_01820 [Nitrosopumilus sp. H13]
MNPKTRAVWDTFAVGDEFTMYDYAGRGRAIHHIMTSKSAYDAIRNGILIQHIFKMSSDRLHDGYDG